ncbi:MAG: hypothetical protein WCD20_13710 [Rhodomicrobium sp.]
MDELFNSLNSPAFWFLFSLSILGNVLANRLDKKIPPVSVLWLEAFIYLYSLFGVAVTLHAYFLGGYFPFTIPHENLPKYPTSNKLAEYYPLFLILMTFTLPMFVIFHTRVELVNTPRFHKWAAISIGTPAAISFAYSLCALVLNKGWTKEAYGFFIISAVLPLVISCFFLVASVSFAKRTG